MAGGRNDLGRNHFAAGAGHGDRAVLGAGGIQGGSRGVHVAGSRNHIGGIGIAAAVTGVNQVSVDFFGVIVMSQSFDNLVRVALTAGTDVSSAAILGTGGLGNDYLIIVSGGGDFFGITVAASGAGIGNGTVLCTGGFSDYSFIAVTGGFNGLAGIAVAACGTQIGDIPVFGAGPR